MKMIIGYIRMECASRVLRKLHAAGVGGVTAYGVRGMSSEASTFLHSKRPFELDHLPESLKIEIICDEASVDKIMGLIAGQANTGLPGDGWICIENIDRVCSVRDLVGDGN